MLGFVTMRSKNQWLGDASVRVGFIPVGHAMIYGRVGYGFGGGEFTVADLVAGQTATANPTLSGLMWGGGIEVPFSNNWLGRVEYKQYDFGTVSVTTPSLTTFTMKDRVDTITAGLSYRF
jgi:outer membrane immunogenic protein